jgi:hypothetical protein
MEMDDDFQDPINLHCYGNLQARTSTFGRKDLDNDNFIAPPSHPLSPGPSQTMLGVIIPEELFKQSVSRQGLRSGNTGQKKRQDPEKKKLLEVTEANGVSFVVTINHNVYVHKEVSEMVTKT